MDAANTSTPWLLAENPQISAQTNRITDSGYSYDDAGNLTGKPGGASYSYDAENRMASANNGQVFGLSTYTYDGDGRRVRKLTGTGTVETVFVYDAAGRMIAEYANAPASTNGTQFLTQDALGTPRVVTDSNQLVKARSDYLPFGEAIDASATGRSVTGYGTDAGERQKFTGKERDAESGLDYFGARYYSSAQGRFISPDDFAGGPTELFADVAAHNPTFYADIAEPQSLNKYQYCLNNPLSYLDPDGHQSTKADAIIPTTDETIGFGKGIANILIGMGNVTKIYSGQEPTKELKPDNRTQAVMMVLVRDVSLFGGFLGGRGTAGMVAADAEETGAVAAEVGNAAAEAGTAERAAEPVAATRRAARRETMRREGIPTSQQPDSQISSEGGRQYRYTVPKRGGGSETKLVTNNLKDRGHPRPHFEAGRPKVPHRTDSVGRLRVVNDKTKVNY